MTNWPQQELEKVYAELKTGEAAVELDANQTKAVLAGLVLDARAQTLTEQARVLELETRTLSLAKHIAVSAQNLEARAVSGTKAALRRWALPVALTISGPLLLDFGHQRWGQPGATALLIWGACCLLIGGFAFFAALLDGPTS